MVDLEVLTEYVLVTVDALSQMEGRQHWVLVRPRAIAIGILSCSLDIII